MENWKNPELWEVELYCTPEPEFNKDEDYIDSVYFLTEEDAKYFCEKKLYLLVYRQTTHTVIIGNKTYNHMVEHASYQIREIRNVIEEERFGDIKNASFTGES